jgi:hypothetical protein
VFFLCLVTLSEKKLPVSRNTIRHVHSVLRSHT